MVPVRENGCGHSADVQMELRVGGHVLPIAQLGPDFLILENPFDHPAAQAEIFLSIDRQESCWPVRLVDGICHAQPRTHIHALQFNGPTVT